MKWLLPTFALVLLLTTALMTLTRRENSGWIAYQLANTGSSAIYLMTGDGRAHQRLTALDLCAAEPRWSPDGRWLSFINICSGENNLLRMGIGTRPQLISTELPRSIRAEWSPDGERLVVEGGEDLYIVEVHDGSARRLPYGYSFVEWSPDGEWIYARRRVEGNLNLERIHVESGAAEFLVDAEFIRKLSWSPDGNQLLFRTEADELAIMSPDGADLTPIPIDDTDRGISHAIWSPDGQCIVFSTAVGIPSSVYRVRPDGSDLELMAELTSGSILTQWSSDGEWLLVGAVYDGLQDIYRIRADGTSAENLTPQTLTFDPEWAFAPQYAPATGRDFHPLLLTVAALGMLVIPQTKRFLR